MCKSNNLALHALANCCQDRIIGTLEKYRVGRQLNLVSVSEHLVKIYFWKYFLKTFVTNKTVQASL